MEHAREVSERQRRIAAVVLFVLGLVTVAIAAWPGGGGAGAALGPGRIDINLAGARELELLPGIGPALAERIVAERERNGPFASVDDLRRVSGMGERLVRRVGPHATAGE